MPSPDFAADVHFHPPSRRFPGTPVQGMRTDIRYGDDPPTQVWMVWPTFVDEAGQPLPPETPLPAHTRAVFTILDPDLRELHRLRLSIGARFQMVAGAPVADCTVTAILGLANGSAA